MAAGHDLLDDAFLRRADIIFSAEDLIGRREELRDGQHNAVLYVP